MSRGRKKEKTTMKRANGTGSIRKLSGNRRKPYQVMITTGYGYDKLTFKTKQILKQLGTYETRELAEQALNEYNNNPFDFETATITFGEIYELWSSRKYKKLSKSTVSTYISAYKYCESIKDVSIKDLRTAHLQAVIDACSHGSNTKVNIKVIMSAVFDYAEKNDIVSKNYARFIEIEESDATYERVIFSIDEITMLHELDSNCYVQIILILLYSGMRVNELLQMKRECCDLKDNVLDIIKAKNKTSIRKVPIHDKIRPYIENFYNKHGDNLIVNDSGFTVPYNNFATRQFKSIMKQIHAEHRIHDTRHTFISRAKECNLDTLYTKKIVGHALSDITSKVYTHIDIAKLKNEINKLYY